jgi:hypothetical protein
MPSGNQVPAPSSLGKKKVFSSKLEQGTDMTGSSKSLEQREKNSSTALGNQAGKISCAGQKIKTRIYYCVRISMSTRKRNRKRKRHENRCCSVVWRPNRRTWFWGSTKKHVLIVSMCTVEIADDVTRPPDHLVTEYLTRGNIPILLHQVFYSYHDPRRCPACRTCQLHNMKQANMILHTDKDKGKTNQNVPDSNSNLGMSMTHHISNQGTDGLVSQLHDSKIYTNLNSNQKILK